MRFSDLDSERVRRGDKIRRRGWFNDEFYIYWVSKRDGSGDWLGETLNRYYDFNLKDHWADDWEFFDDEKRGWVKPTSFLVPGTDDIYEHPPVEPAILEIRERIEEIEKRLGER